MALTFKDIEKLQILFQPQFERIRKLEDRFSKFQENMGILMDMVMDIKLRLDRDQLPFIEARIGRNT